MMWLPIVSVIAQVIVSLAHTVISLLLSPERLDRRHEVYLALKELLIAQLVRAIHVIRVVVLRR